MIVLWCTVHNSVVPDAEDDDGSHIFLCNESTRTADREPCVCVEAEVTWPSQ